MPESTPHLPENPLRRNLWRLFILRNLMIAFLSAAALILAYLDIPLPDLPVILAISAMLMLNAFTWFRVRQTIAIKTNEVAIQLLGDLVTLTALFYFTGGYSNPLIWMYLLPLTIAAVALPKWQAWLLTALAMVCYSVLVFYYVPLSHLHMHYHEGSEVDIHLVGMWIGFLVSASIVAVFVTRIGQNLRDYDHMIATARESALESERMLALGTLAASAAHELGTPLSTMAVIAKELQLSLPTNRSNEADAAEKLHILITQISRCKEILSSLAASSGRDRALSGQRLHVSEFLKATISRWADTRPATVLNFEPVVLSSDPLFFADRTLGQALQNLLDNAADASPEQITMTAECNGQALKVSIRDYGAGLAAQDLDQIGQPFFSTKDKPEPGAGLGLGIYLSRAILARYNGALELNNHADGGVLTSIYLPLGQLKMAAS